MYIVHYTANSPCYKQPFYIERDDGIDPKLVWITPDHIGYWTVPIEDIHREEDCIKLKFIEFMKSL